MNFSEWTEEDVLRHNARIKSMPNSNKKVPKTNLIKEDSKLPIKNEKVAKKSKYRNEKVVIDGTKYDSKKEAKRAEQLETLERLGLITDLEKQKKYVLQPSFKFMGKTIREIAYVADFVYKEHGDLVVEDVKSPVTRVNPVYKLKKKMMLYVHNIEIREV